MRKFLSLVFVLILAFSLTSCSGGGGAPVSTGGSTGASQQQSTGGTPTPQGGGELNGTYHYAPVTDHFYIEWTSGEHTYFAAGIGDEFVYTPLENMVTYIDYTTGFGWSREIDGTQWYEDDYDYQDGEQRDMVGTLSAMEDYFLPYFRAYGFEDEELSEHFVGTEKVAGIDCWVFDTKQLNAIEMKFWIDPANGCCLKYQSTEGGVPGHTVETTVYNLNYTSWGENMKPEM